MDTVININSGRIVNDGFDSLIKFHRCFGLLYINYKQIKRWKNIFLIIYGLFIAVIIILFNTPCIIYCHYEESNIGGIVALYIYTTLAIIVNIINISTSTFHSLRGSEFGKTIKLFRKLVYDKRLEKWMRSYVFAYIFFSLMLVFGKIIVKSFIFWRNIFLDMIEDAATEVLFYSTDFLLLYFALYLNGLLDQLIRELKTVVKNGQFFNKYDYFYEYFFKIQNLITKTNQLLSPSLLLLFLARGLMIISMSYLLVKSFNPNSKFPLQFSAPLILFSSFFLILNCFAVESINSKVNTD